VNAPLYTLDILRLASSLSPPVELDQVDGEAELYSPTCGSRIRTVVSLDADKRVTSISQQVHACAFGQASAALLEARAPGLDLAGARASLDLLTRWLAGEQKSIGDWPELSDLEPARSRQARHGAILLPLRTLVAALESCA
jgi:NifU-like protein involved in Fe-S cluster formation